ncbi:sodium- and chloride-dependent glycine transporter 1-like isoform X2 [Drosophila teissieri]|uniref:sodium- and chloride-dependent glycine transporter 1-like isoform X2 n=1 Tax=Drosophila teissieri TaxID=7243 RepID=UPI001CBA2684|nr:sodium- and chloride-dependent glycine transporter 1-like isoform X2 [Drosophila teissieri]
MVYETSYETSYDIGLKLFSPDPNRGRWDKPTDYIFACFGLALKLDVFLASYWMFYGMGMCFVRYLFLPGAINGLNTFLSPKLINLTMGLSSTFIMVIHAFGAGWGSVIALSSFNGFKTNIMSYSWIISFGQIFIYIMFGLVSCMLEWPYIELSESYDYSIADSRWLIYLSSASVLTTMAWPNLWIFIYYSMLLLAALIVMTTQIFTVLQSLFDEFEILRVRKQLVTFGLIGGIAVCSLYFCTNRGKILVLVLGLDASFSSSLLHLLLIFVVLWIYGRERFQRDMEFMLGQPFASWKVFTLRFIAPIFLVICLIDITFLYGVKYTYSTVVVVVMPILAIPGYGLYHLYQCTGTIRERFKRTCRPTDWYPVETEHRQQYEEALDNSDMTQQLCEVTEEVN